jgi:hypothetical protein
MTFPRELHFDPDAAGMELARRLVAVKARGGARKLRTQKLI